MKTRLLLLACLFLPTASAANPGPSAAPPLSASVDLNWSPSPTPAEQPERRDDTVLAAAEPLLVVPAIRVAGLGLFAAGKPYFRAQRETHGPGLHIAGPFPR